MLKDLKWKASLSYLIDLGSTVLLISAESPCISRCSIVVYYNLQYLSAAHFTIVQYLCEAEKKATTKALQFYANEKAKTGFLKHFQWY